MRKIGFFFTVLFFSGCSETKIEITPEYIINENWSKENDEPGGNAIKIERMNLKKDSTMNLFLDSTVAEILPKLEIDSLFRWYANIKIKEESYKNKKIYFNKDNGFTWLDDVENRRTMIFGNLQNGNWYKFSDLVTSRFYVYVYVDSLNKAHRFDVDLSNY